MSNDANRRTVGHSEINLPTLSIRGPVFYALATALVFIAAGVFWAQRTMLEQTATISALVVMPADEAVIRSSRAGTIIQIYVSAGEQVKAGQLVARLDNNKLNAQIKSLTSSLVAARAELTDVRSSVKKALLARQVSVNETKEQMAALSARLKGVAQRTRMLNRRIKQAELEVSHAQIYADVSGRIEMIQGIGERSAVSPGSAIMKIAGSNDQLLIKAVLPVDLGAGLHTRARARVVLYDTAGLARGPYEARLQSSRFVEDGNSTAQQPHGEVIYTLIAKRSQIAKHIALQSGMRAKVLIKSGEQTVLSKLF